MHVLDRHPVFRVDSPDRLEVIARQQFGAKIDHVGGAEGDFLVEANHATLIQSDLWYCAYQTPVTVKFPEGDFLRLQVPKSGSAKTRVKQQETLVAAQQGCISSADAAIEFGQNYRQLVWRMPMAVLRHRLSVLIDRPLVAPLVFAPTFDFSSVEGRAFLALLGTITAILDAPSSHATKLIIGELEQAAAVAFLLASDHSFRVDVRAESATAAPWQVRRVESHIEAHWNQPLEIDDIVAITGVSARSMFRSFKKFRGYSPMQFARIVRLRHARRMVEDCDGCLKLTDIALICGWPDLSRFSKDFTAAFGLTPSQLLGRRRH